MREPTQEPKNKRETADAEVMEVTTSDSNEPGRTLDQRLQEMRPADELDTKQEIADLERAIHGDVNVETTSPDERIFEQLNSGRPNETVVSTEIVTAGDRRIFVRYLTKESLGAYFGYQVGSHVAVRHDLPPRARNFVLQHELYHATDEASWGGWIGRELRANAGPALKDPIGA